MKGWRRVFEGLGGLAIGVAVGGGIGIIFGGLNPDPDNARYLLSAMPQVIGTVFVLTVAIMQAVGGSEGMPLKKLFRQPEFWTAAIISLVGIAGPLMILYSGKFCWSTALFLGLGVGNLLVIGWFVWRVGTLQLVSKRLARLKKEALEALEFDVHSELFESIDEIKQLGEKAINSWNNALVKDAARLIVAVADSKYNKYKDVWEGCADSLIAFDRKIRKVSNFDLSKAVTIPLLRSIVINNKYPQFTPSEAWDKVQSYFFECLREDINAKRVDFRKELDPQQMDGLDAVVSLLSPTISIRGPMLEQKWHALQSEFEVELLKAMKNPDTRRFYEPHAVFALLFQFFIVKIIAVGGVTKEYLDSVKSSIIEFAKAIGESPLKLLEDSEDSIKSLKYREVVKDINQILPWFARLKGDLRNYSAP